MSATRTILVGYDGSDDATAALDWAVREAVVRDCQLHVLYVAADIAAMDAAAVSLAGMPVSTRAIHMDDPAGILDQARDRVARSGVRLTATSTVGAPARVLVEQSTDAALLVMGSRGLGSAASLVLGSSVIHVTAHAHCPVVVAQAGGALDGPVVVGVDASPASQEPLGWAFAHADSHGVPLEVLHTFAIPVYPGVVPYVPPVELTRGAADFAQRTVHEVLAGWRERYPDVTVTTKVVHNRPGPALIDASARASITIVGTRGRGAFLGMLLGSTSQALLHHARGTVIVVPPHSTEG